MNKPTINEMMTRTLAAYGDACRRWGTAIARKEHGVRRMCASEASRHLVLMHHLISMIKTAPNLGEDITATDETYGMDRALSRTEEPDDTMDHEEVESN